MTKILIGSPIRQTPTILREFLDSLRSLDVAGFEVRYFLVDDNDDPVSSQMLTEFSASGPCVIRPGASTQSSYRREGPTHTWPNEAVWRVAAYKDLMIEHAVAEHYDALFLVDSDLVLHPQTLTQLWSSEADIISEVFWTRWDPGQPELPQVWQSGQYDLTPEFVEQLRSYGVFPVGGLGACTLLRSPALQAGVRFHKVQGLDTWGEDRHFCARATSLGFDLCVDTHYPAYHLYRDEDIYGVASYRAAYGHRHLEVSVVQSAKNTLETWGSSDWRTMNGLEGLDGLAGDFRQAEMERAATKLQTARNRHTVASTAVLKTKVVALDRAGGLAQTEVHLINEGVDLGQRFMDVMRVNLTHVLQDGKWFIADMQFSPEDADSAALGALCDAYLRRKAKDLIGKGRAAEALDFLLGNQDRMQKSPDLLVTVVEALISQGRYTNAREILLQVLPAVPKHTGLLCGLARICELEGDRNTAEQVISLIRKLGSPAGLAYVETFVGRLQQTSAPGVILRDKKKIALLYDSASGSNTLALFKLTPAELQERYQLELIRNPFDFMTRLKASDKDLVVTTHGYYPFDSKQPNLELWHGFPLKAMGLMDKNENHDTFGGQWRFTDKIASYSPLFSTLMNACIGKTINHYVVTGAPRNDFLFVSDGRANLSRLLGEPLGSRRVVLFMPTFRIRPGGVLDGMDTSTILGKLGVGSKRFERFLAEHNILFLLKLHPAEEQLVLSKLNPGRSSSVRVLSTRSLDENQLDLYETLNAVDVLLTDYSSVYFDYLLLNRPILFATVDYEEYQENRGFLLEPYSSWTPGPSVADPDSLERELLRSLSDPDCYRHDRERIARIVHQYHDGASTERVWHVMEAMLESGDR